MAIFYCSECNFSKTVKDEMAGKKARCPKCNAVNTVLEIGQTLEDVLGESAAQEVENHVEAPAASEPEQEAPAASRAAAESTETTTAAAAATETAAEASETAADGAEEAPKTATENSFASKTSDDKQSQPVKFKISAGWLMAFGAALLPVIAGILLLCFRLVDPAMISFALGILAFGGLAAYYSFK